MSNPTPRTKRWALSPAALNRQGWVSISGGSLQAGGYGVFVSARDKGTLVQLEVEGWVGEHVYSFRSAPHAFQQSLELDITSDISIRKAVEEDSDVTGGVLHCLVDNVGTGCGFVKYDETR